MRGNSILCLPHPRSDGDSSSDIHNTWLSNNQREVGSGKKYNEGKIGIHGINNNEDFTRASKKDDGKSMRGDKNKGKRGNKGKGKTESNNEDSNNKHEGKTKKVPLSKLKQYLTGENLYDYMGISPGAAAADIRKAYLKKALNFHPDRCGKDADENSDSKFLFLKEAYDALLDPEFRNAYDSALPTDDSIPDPKLINISDDFYRLFGESFRQNSKWSSKHPVPMLGNANTDLGLVQDFYRFWRCFQSKRDFTHCIAEEIEDSNDRREKRWLDQQKAKATKKYLEAEAERISKLVELAYKHDPRVACIQKMREIEKEKLKNEKKMKRIMSRHGNDLSCINIKTTNIIHNEPNDTGVKTLEEKKPITTNNDISINKSNVSVKIYNGNSNQIDKSTINVKISNKVDINYPQKTEIITKDNCPSEEMKSKTNHISIREKQTESAETKNQTITEEKQCEVKPWTEQELAELAILTVRYPQGTSNRWGVISHHLVHRSQQEIIEKAKQLKKTPNSAIDSTKPQTKNIAKIEENKSKNTPTIDHKNQKATNAPDTNDWTVNEQKAFEEALQMYRTLPLIEKWVAVAACVKTKNAKQCLMRFEMIKSAIVAGRNGK